ncbi:disease resistance protein L6-like isoform X1 [Macadamia integrifolia]|uniref:disease resistance protein L6-like isoform X1 n=1 Tax=Macadamia integrifolia TaxID=60698 RepID=UPI001C4F7015|nr:disease resistance protein L6-like isoform X1 [Macadamia integrifolia]
MAASSRSSSGWSYDVFLSFRGEDTRNTFTGHLYNALDDAGIHIFKDDERLPTGEEIGPELLSAIEESRISIPIFSKNYASSKWCLNELVKIVECRKTMNQLVLPIFYDVGPSDVRNHTESYGKALREHQKNFNQTIIEEWKGAMREVGELKGWDLKKIANGHEGTLVKLVVAEVSNKLRKDAQIVSDDLVGIQSHVEKVMRLLDIESKDIKIVGVQGLGGIGKTTIAKVVYNTILHQFEGCSFLANVCETSQQYRGLIDLQNRLVSNILKGARFNFTNVDEGINVIRKRLCRKKVLIILDDVDHKIQLDALIRKHGWFGLGSRIIITTRNGHILASHEVDEVYEPNEMDANQSLRLFSRHAFRRDQPPDDYLDLSKDIVKNTGGLPLALEVIGSALFDMRISAWQDTLKMLQDHILHDEILQKLKISYDGLKDSEKEIFLDIACFLAEMDKSTACFIWQHCNFHPGIGVEVLCQKSLVKIGENNELKMHDLLRDLGKEIIRQENVKVPGGRSRLWSHKEVLDVLDKSAGTDKVEGLCIDFGGNSGSQCCLKSEEFTKMAKLRLLRVDYACFAPDFVPSFSELVWLRWKGCPQEFTLMKLHPVNLVVLDLSYSLITINWMGWKYIKVAKNLKVLNLAECQYLFRTPELANHRLEVLILENCKNLVGIDESINYLERLVILNIRGCSKLRDLPYSIWGLASLRNLNIHQCEGLDKLPDSIGFLKNLVTFDASFCYIKDGGIPDALWWLSFLEILRIGGNNFHCLPVTVSSLSLLHTLDLRFCYRLQSLPELPSSLKILNVTRCRSLKSLPRLSNLTNLEVLCLDDCENLVEMPALSGLRNLENLSLDNCQRLEEIKGLKGLDSLKLLTMKNCGSLRKIEKISSLRELKESRFTGCSKLMVLEMEGCERLLEIEGLVGLDSLERLTIKGCTSLMQISELSELDELPQMVFEQLPLLQLCKMKNFRMLEILNCRSIERLPHLFNLGFLKHLSIAGCIKLKEIEGLNGLAFLVTLNFNNCISMERIPSISYLTDLKHLSTVGCLSLKEIQGLGEPWMIQCLDKFGSLERLDFNNCISMENLPDLSYRRNLKHLSIAGCVNLKQIQGLDRLKSLERLDFTRCEFIKRLPDLSNLRKLKHLSAAGCINLKDIQGLNKLESLETLDFSNCISMERLPDLSNLRNLKHLSITGCVNLKESKTLTDWNH